MAGRTYVKNYGLLFY